MLPEGKQSADWLDQDTLLVGRDWGSDTLTESGYPYVLKRWKRGEPLEKAVEVFRGKKTDVRAGTQELRDAEGRLQAMIIERGVTFFESEFYLLTEPQQPVAAAPAAQGVHPAFVRGPGHLHPRAGLGTLQAGSAALLRAGRAAGQPRRRRSRR